MGHLFSQVCVPARVGGSLREKLAFAVYRRSAIASGVGIDSADSHFLDRCSPRVATPFQAYTSIHRTPWHALSLPPNRGIWGPLNYSRESRLLFEKRHCRYSSEIHETVWHTYLHTSRKFLRVPQTYSSPACVTCCHAPLGR